MAFTYAAAVGGGVMRSDGAYVPTDTDNRDKVLYDAYQGPTDAEPTLSLSDHKAQAYTLLSVDADAERAKHMPRDPTAAAITALRFDEARRADAEGSPQEADYPILASEVTHTAPTFAGVITAVEAERQTYLSSIAAIQTVEKQTQVSIDGAADQASVDAVLDAVIWPA